MDEAPSFLVGNGRGGGHPPVSAGTPIVRDQAAVHQQK
jgi:hypothetical protein